MSVLDLGFSALATWLSLFVVPYRELLDEVRYGEARRYLSSTGLTVQAIAGLLDYADARSFRTAFRRWAGVTPAAFRLQNRTAGSPRDSG